jgi:hypothetical protein
VAQRRLQARRRSDSAVYIGRGPALATDGVVMIVVNSHFIPSRTADRLNLADKSDFNQNMHVIVHGLGRKRA